MISNNLTQLNYYFPWSFLIALVIAIIFAILGVIIFRRALKSGGEKTSPDVTSSPLLEKGKTFFARFGLVPSNTLAQSFTYALQLMHTFIGGSQFRYQLPWIVMFGASSSGKSTILENLNLDKPIGRPHFEDENGDKPLCDWWFFNYGIVLDLDGRLIFTPSATVSDDSNWKLFLNLLANHRAKRPLDGIVLTLPASEMVGSTALSHDDILIRAEYLYGKLWEMQRITGIRVPIYVVMTKCDFIPGFTSFCKSLPQRLRHDIFGWSNNHAIDSVYTSEWIYEAFSTINTSLYRAKEEIYAEGASEDERDGVFLFPLALNQLQGRIRTYMDHLFKLSSYHESFFLRGIYFTGNSQQESQSLSGDSSDLNLLWMFTPEEKEKKKSLYFIDNLFDKKIFREKGVARPVSRVLLGNTSILKLAKGGVAVAAIIGTLGLLRANEVLQTAKMNLKPALTQIEITLEKTRGQNEGTDIGRVFFEDQATVLLNTMTQISVNRLSSIFIPSSWFSTLDSKIKYVMILAYDRVILRSLASQLAYKADQLFSLNTVIPVTDVIGNGIDPLETSEFYRLKNYILAVRSLELAASKFNELGVSSGLKDVADIIKYLFNYDMPPGFYENDRYYVNALNRTALKLFDFNAYRDSASVKLRKLFDEFQLVVFDPNEILPGLGRLMLSLNEFSGTRNYAAYDADILRQVFLSLQETINSIQSPAFQWLDADHFNPGPQYEYVVGLMVGSNFFSSNTATDLISEVDQNFINFRSRLAGYKSTLIKGGYLFKNENALAISKPSEGALDLQKNLTLFFNQEFMEPSESKTILTAIPIGSVLLWDTLRLQEAVHLVDVYNNFVNSHLLSLPKTLQPMLQKVARESLTKNIVRFIADAEVFSSDTASGSNFSPEDSLLSQVQNYRVAAPYLQKMLFALRANNANSAFSTLKSLLASQVYRPLEKLDAILTEEAPYAIQSNSFDWWVGKNLAGLEAYGVSNLTALKNYLDLQRDRINYLAREFAEPLVSFLSEINKEGMPGNMPLATKWAGIVDELNGYERKVPGSGLVGLENFIMNTLNEVTLNTCQKYASMVSALSVSQDFFVSILVDLQEKLHDRCVALSGYVSADNYSQLAEFFNANLAGKFPFVDLSTQAASNAHDAAPEDLHAFFQMMDSQGSSVKATLQQATNLGPAGKTALAFIEQMEKIRNFFGDYLTPTFTLPNPAFSYNVTFRVNKERESHANEILDWGLTTQDTIISMRSSSHKGYWEAGNPVKMNFRWALNSPLQPLMTAKNPNLEVQGENAIFSYTGTWAFLHLLLQNKAAPSDFDSLKDEHPITLRFDIPLTNTSSNNRAFSGSSIPQARVFVRVEILPVAKSSGKKKNSSDQSGSEQDASNEKIRPWVPLSLPSFPSRAPVLNGLGG